MWSRVAVLAVALVVVPLGGATDGGALDPAWGAGGWVDTHLGYGAPDAVEAVAVQPDGKVIVVGTRHSSGLPDRFGGIGSHDLVAVRYAATGRLDAFAAGGVLALDPSGADDYGYDLALQPDGKTIVVGAANAGPASYDAVVARVHPDGQLDLSFDRDGLKFLDAGAADAAFAVALAADGTLVVAGRAGRPGAEDAVVYRLYSNGDPATLFFRDRGRVVLDTAPDVESAVDVAVTTLGQIVLLVRRRFESAVYRLNGDGTLDRTWAGDGSAELPGLGEAVALQSDGKLLVAGSSGVVRFSVAGGVDTTFGGGALVVPGVTATSVAATADGRVVVGGTAGIAPARDFAAIRLEADGRPDTSFDGDGIAAADLGGDEHANAVAVQPDGKIVVAGGASRAGNVALARFLPGACTVPGLVGWREQTAGEALVANECRVGRITRAHSSRARGRIVSQSHPRGATLADRATVDLVVSLGPKPKRKRR